jgi:hypothetical protein
MGTEPITMTNSHRTPAPTPSSQEIAKRGAAIYKQKYQHDLEQTANGKFVAINVYTSDATVAESSEQAIEQALKKDPQGLFHLVRVGHQAAFDAGWFMSYAR